MSFQLSPVQVEAILYDLCVVFGFCLPPDEQARLRELPPNEVDAFTDTVIRAEGLNPDVDVPLRSRRQMKATVAEHFRKAEDEQQFRQRV
ncbi:MAG TPA: hypothetical protein PK529_11100 [Verrucomicrobiales bacterium]|nr:hypothetical protein [Verrucomicrobiales bacterium]